MYYTPHAQREDIGSTKSVYLVVVLELPLSLKP